MGGDLEISDGLIKDFQDGQEYKAPYSASGPLYKCGRGGLPFYSCSLSTVTIEYSCPSACLHVCVCVCLCT